MQGLNVSFTQAWPIEPSDTVQVSAGAPTSELGAPASACLAILALTDGDVTARFAGDRANSAVTFPVLAGTLYPFSLTYVYLATTATLLGLR
jgi:hypothetical protein